jgi:hypothetical protein
MSRREERERTEFLQRQQQDAINRSIDDTKDNIRRAIEEVRRETPRYSQTVTDFQNETADATREIADNFLDSQKEVINSLQSTWTPFADRTSSSAGTTISGNNNYWMMMGMIQPWWWMGVSPRDMADIYARSISAMADSVAAGTRMATNMLFAGIESSRAATNYARHNSKEIARLTSNTARIFGQNAKDTVSRMQEGGYGDTTTGTAASTTGKTTGTTEEKETDTSRRK